MHNTTAKNVVSTERTSLKDISMARLIFKLQLCNSAAYSYPYASDEEGASRKIVTIYSTQGEFEVHIREEERL